MLSESTRSSRSKLTPRDPLERYPHFDVSGIPRNVVGTVFVFRARSLGSEFQAKRPLVRWIRCGERHG
jgi:hypothetical protein